MLVATLGVLVLVPAALAQDDNLSRDDLRGEDRGGERAFDDNPSRDDLGADDNGRDRAFDDSPTGDDVVVSPASSATPTATAAPEASANSPASPSASPAASPTTTAPAMPMLPDTSGFPPA